MIDKLFMVSNQQDELKVLPPAWINLNIINLSAWFIKRSKEVSFFYYFLSLFIFQAFCPITSHKCHSTAENHLGGCSSSWETKAEILNKFKHDCCKYWKNATVECWCKACTALTLFTLNNWNGANEYNKQRGVSIRLCCSARWAAVYRGRHRPLF